MPVNTMIRNLQAGPTVFTPDLSSQPITWEGAHDPNGGDVQPISEAVLELAQFQRILRRGVLEVVADDSAEVDRAMELQKAQWDGRQAQSEQSANDSIEHTEDVDQVVVTCIGPSPRAGQQCGVMVPVRDAEKNKKPPLCDQHIRLASEFVPTDTIVDGKSATQWIRSTMAPRERQQN